MTSFKSYSPKGSQKISITTSYYNYFEELLTKKFTKTNNFFEKLLTKKSAKDLILQFQRKYSVVLWTFWWVTIPRSLYGEMTQKWVVWNGRRNLLANGSGYRPTHLLVDFNYASTYTFFKLRHSYSWDMQ